MYNVSNPDGLDHGYLCKKAGSLYGVSSPQK